MNSTQLYFGRRILLFSNYYIGYCGSGRFRWSGGDGDGDVEAIMLWWRWMTDGSGQCTTWWYKWLSDSNISRLWCGVPNLQLVCIGRDGCIGGDSAGHGVNSWSCEVGGGVTKTSTY